MEKKRCTNFSAMEINLLKDIALSKSNIIENKHSDATTWRAKKRCWEEIALEFNSRSLKNRTADTLKKKWENMKKGVKDKVTGQRKYAMGTGGGPPMPPPNLTKDEQSIFSLIGLQAVGTESVCDSDFQPNTPMSFPSDLSENEHQPDSPIRINLTSDNDIEDLESNEDNNNRCNEVHKKWNDYTPNTLRTAPTLQLTSTEPTDDKESPFRRYRKHTFTGQRTNKAWTELAHEKKDLCQLKKRKYEALIAESVARKKYYDLQCQLLEMDIAKKKREQDSKDFE